MTTLTKKSIGSNRRLAFNAALASAATAATFVGLVAAMPTTAYAAWPAEDQRELVRYRDLDLTTDDGAMTLRARVNRAARRVCAAKVSPLIRPHRRKNTCVHEAARNGQADADQVIARHRVTRRQFD